MSNIKFFQFYLFTVLLLLFAGCQKLDQEESEWQKAVTENTLETFTSYLAHYPDGKYSTDAEYSLGRLFSSAKNFKEALAYYEQLAARKPDDLTAKRSCIIAALGLKGEYLYSDFEAFATGMLQPIEGPWGISIPVDSKFHLEGKSECSIGDQKLTAEIEGWSYLYKPSTSDIAGWGAVVRQGDIVLSSSDYDAMKQGKLDFSAEQQFDAIPLDYLGRYVLLHIEAEKNQKFIIPILTPYFIDLQGYSVSGMAPGSVYSVGGYNLETALPTTVNLFGINITHYVKCKLYNAGDGSTPAGIMVDKKGVRRGFNTNLLRMVITGTAKYEGYVQLTHKDTDKNRKGGTSDQDNPIK